MEIVIGYAILHHGATWEIIVLCKSGATWSLGTYRSRSAATRAVRDRRQGDPVFYFGC